VRPFDLLQPTDIDAAVALLAQHGDEARLIGGGAMLMILLRERLIDPRYLIDVLGIAGLDEISVDRDGMSVGATATLSALERSDEVREHYPVLAEALRLVGNVRVRNVATLGGHLAQADIHLDLPPVLVALGASVSVRGPHGERSLPLEALVVGYYETSLSPDEMIVSTQLPRPPVGLRGAYLKYCSLTPNDWPTVGVAAFFAEGDGRPADARVVVGSVSERPLRLAEAEALLLGDHLGRRAVAEVARRYAAAAEPMADVRGSVEYKRTVTEVYVRRAIEAAAARAGLVVGD
jgi:carbon-monoxide dehydrogenase medium subunit